jgi:hypothetical protein
MMSGGAVSTWNRAISSGFKGCTLAVALTVEVLISFLLFETCCLYMLICK